MRTTYLLKRNLFYFWRTNLAVILGVAIAVGVLAGALLVGESVRASLRSLFLQRLGNTSHVVSSTNFFREQLSTEIKSDARFAAAGFNDTCPIIVLEGTVVHDASKKRSAGVQVYGVDARFWKFHGLNENGPGQRDAFISVGLEQELSAATGDTLLLRVVRQSDIPTESLHGRKEDTGRTLRLELRKTLSPAGLGDFTIRPQQSSVRAIFVPIELLQTELEQPGKANAVLVSQKSDATNSKLLEQILDDTISLSDMGVKVRAIESQGALSVESDSALLNDTLAIAAGQSATELNFRSLPVLSYLANSITANNKAVPYSIVSAVDPSTFPGLSDRRVASPIVLNDWAAKALNAKPGDEVWFNYYYWYANGSLVEKNAKFIVTEIVQIKAAAADRELVPEYPGITGSENITDWDPPFPVDLSHISRQDEDYWHQYRTTPKAFIPISKGQELWGTRFGKLTSLRVVPTNASELNKTLGTFQKTLRAKLRPGTMGFFTLAVRSEGLAASRGATDFGEYFLYFSFFLVASALMLAGLFFKLGVEQRLREIGTLQAIGFPASRIRRLFLGEGLVLAAIGSLLGIGFAIAYGKLMMLGLGSWWVGATGTSNLSLHVGFVSLIIGGIGGMIAALLSIIWALRRVGRASVRSLLQGTSIDSVVEKVNPKSAQSRWRIRFPFPAFVLFAVLGVLFILLASTNVIGNVVGFFGGGTMLLVALLTLQWKWLSRGRGGSINGSGWYPILRMGFRNATHRPARSVLSIALIASAAFIIVAVDAFRRHDNGATQDRKSGTGGYALLGESDLPLIYDPSSSSGREELNLATDQGSGELTGVAFERFRLRPGDDSSCLNLYEPRNPRILGATEGFISANRFGFQDSIARTDEEKANPWSLLNHETEENVVPVIADANSMTYVLHRKLGDELVLDQGTAGPVRFRFVAALADSIFQSELIMSEKNFLKLFPDTQGYRVFLVDSPASIQPMKLSGILEDRLSGFGFDTVSTRERLAEFHRVENTYLSTFQMLGGLGLVLGTLGLAAILLRNVLERRRELALLRAVGYGRKHFAAMVIAENSFMLLSGLVIGTVSALLAIAPVFLARSGQLPIASLGVLLLAVVMSGLVASVAGTVAALRSPLLPALKAE